MPAGSDRDRVRPAATLDGSRKSAAAGIPVLASPAACSREPPFRVTARPARIVVARGTAAAARRSATRIGAFPLLFEKCFELGLLEA